MARHPLPVLAPTISFIDRVNHTDLAALTHVGEPALGVIWVAEVSDGLLTDLGISVPGRFGAAPGPR